MKTHQWFIMNTSQFSSEEQKKQSFETVKQRKLSLAVFLRDKSCGFGTLVERSSVMNFFSDSVLLPKRCFFFFSFLSSFLICLFSSSFFSSSLYTILASSFFFLSLFFILFFYFWIASQEKWNHKEYISRRVFCPEIFSGFLPFPSL